MSEVHLVTGATGFVGGSLVLELLKQTDSRVICVVRSNDGAAGAQARLETSLAAAALAYEAAELLPEIGRRCAAVPGDILQPLCGIGGLTATVTEIWHCAASLRFEDENETEIFLHNVRGTENVLRLGAELRVPKLNYISTAYVAGSRTGRITEELPDPGTVTNNFYERSKIQAELMVAAAASFHTRILRPSIVIGHSRTLAATSFTGLYGFIRELTRFKRRVARKLGGYLTHRPLRIWAEELAGLNFIPVDAVASTAVGISRSNTPARIFHLTNDCPALLGASMRLLFRELGLREPRFVGSSLPFTSIDEAFDKAIRFYRSYFLNAKVFDRSNTDSIMGPAQWNMDEENLLRHVRWYLAHLSNPADSPERRSLPGYLPHTAVQEETRAQL
jgi:nucleoside-diphosphate-sugar epimerase